MPRSRRLPIETVIAISLLAVALLAGAGIVATSAVGPDRDQSLASSDGPAPEPAPAPDAPPASTPERTTSPSTRPPAGDEPGAPPTTTAPVSPTTVAGTDEPAPGECADLASETSWVRTGDRSPLEAAAGGSARYAEVVTNRGDEPCRLVTSRCEATATLLGADGSPADHQPSSECGSVLTEVVLQPGEQRREELPVSFPVPPGEYQVQVRRYDGTTAALPVVLDDRLPACDPASLSVAVHESDLFRRLEEVVDSGLDVALVLSGSETTCTLRVVESRITLVSGEDEVEIVDATERWSAVEPGTEVRTHALVAPVDLAPGDHEGVVTLVLADGGELTAPFRLLLS